MRLIAYRVLITMLLPLAVACTPPPRVLVEERTVLNSRQEAEKIGGHLIRIVQPGDTLHAIAFVTNLDVNQVAAWNGLDDTEKLKVGQRIRLTKPIGFVYPQPKPVAKVETGPAEAPIPEPGRIVVTDIPKNDSRARHERRRNTSGAESEGFPPVAYSPQTQTLNWHWPTKGHLIAGFSIAKGKQGIDIQAPNGEPVLASANGEVVYVGNSLKGYGNLVIIKHNQSYLSAYAHNSSILVSEGQRIASRQKIGTVGLNKQRVNALHFQIRKNGKPVNPINYLPKI